jgi:hypothetical protein
MHRVLRLTLFAMAATAAAFGQGYFPHVTWGGGWQMTVRVVNLDNATRAAATLSFYDDGGNPLAVSIGGMAATGAYNFTVPPSGATTLILPPDGASVQGWARLDTNGGTVAGLVIFTYHVTGKPDFSATIPFVTDASTCIIPLPLTNPQYAVPFDNSGGSATAIAFANTDSGTSTTTIQIYDEQGALIVSGPLPLPAKGHSSFMLTDKFSEAAGQRGTIIVEADIKQVGVLALLVLPNGTITTLLPLGQ